MWLLFLLSVFYIGLLLHNFFLAKKLNEIKLASVFILGSLFSVTIVFVLLFLFHNLFISLVIYSVGFLIAVTLSFKRVYKEIITYRVNKLLLVIVVIFFLLYILFDRSFSYRPDGNFLIASNLYQDYAVHISFIRYFSEGTNFYPEVNFFAGKKLFYHFMFDFYAGILEYLGARIDVAVNSISVLGLLALLTIIIQFSRYLFKSTVIGILSCGFFLLGTDLSGFLVVKDLSFSPGSLSALYHHNTYPQGNFLGLVTDNYFLNINTYLNQRQLLFALGWLFYCIYIVLQNIDGKFSRRRIVLLSVLLGVFPFWHIPAVVSLYILLLVFAIFFKKSYKSLLTIILLSLVLVLPQLLIIKMHSVNQIIFHPGFLIADELTFKNFLIFWLWNTGFSFPLVILALLKVNSKQRKVFFIFMTLFIVANVFQFSHTTFDNHKLFNIWSIMVYMYTAYALFFLYNKNYAYKLLSILLVSGLTFSGVFHLLVVKNDVHAVIPDYSKTKLMQWVKQNISSSSLIFTNGEIYDPASISGNRIFLGRPWNIYTYGGDPSARIEQRDLILKGKDVAKINKTITNSKIDYIIIYKDKDVKNVKKANIKFLGKYFIKVYEDDFGIIYKI